jgi:hypothetical protein
MVSFTPGERGNGTSWMEGWMDTLLLLEIEHRPSVPYPVAIATQESKPEILQTFQ